MENKEKKLYYVTDQNLIAYLIVDGHKVEDIRVFEGNGRKKVDYYFENTKELFLSIEDYKENPFLQKFTAQLKEVRKTIGQTLRGEKVGE